ncbi:TetR/AcrR family transcriptional regulator [Streptococcus oricebi]|uniref:TetR/AcrR family transcriptional regulator n=1 Tax=Streptococcus oricebi TaxID=1547447 RepID=A0ABS5B1N1_9STRE|nr:TetR/AcrR family transcriptional regulator [Streptococcus oricebi]MBP2622406.1 TetR/AcrR family transcriptional regulator [Streptococcus oricebi]
MYRGTNKTALASQEQISQAFLALLKEDSFDKISVSQICRQAQVSRQTFYSLYQAKDNILLSLLEGQEVLPANQEFNLPFLATRFSFYLKGNIAFLKILKQQKLLYLLYDNLYLKLSQNQLLLPNKDELDRNFILSFLAGGLMGIAKAYLESNGRQSQAELENRILKLLQGKF